jgi:hypothetical protein
VPRRSLLGLSGLLFLIAALLPLSSADARWAVDRLAVETGTDLDAHLVDLSGQHRTRIAAMRSWLGPNVLPAKKRTSPYETQVSVVNATLSAFS